MSAQTQLVGSDVCRHKLVIYSVPWQLVVVLDALSTTKSGRAGMGFVAMHAAKEQKRTPTTAQGTVPGWEQQQRFSHHRQLVFGLDALSTTERALASMGSVAMHAALEQKLTPQTAQGPVPG